MSIPNGLQSPTALAFAKAAQTIGKRKRSFDAEEVKPQVFITEDVDDGQRKQQFHDLLKDVLEILKRSANCTYLLCLERRHML